MIIIIIMTVLLISYDSTIRTVDRLDFPIQIACQIEAKVAGFAARLKEVR